MCMKRLYMCIEVVCVERLVEFVCVVCVVVYVEMFVYKEVVCTDCVCLKKLCV